MPDQKLSVPPLQSGSRSISPVIRLLSGLGALIVFVLGLVMSFGAILAAPVGIWLMRRRAQRRGRRPSAVAAIIGGAVASSVFAGLLWSIIFASAPRPTDQDLKAAVEQSQRGQTARLPDWYLKAFPQASSMDSVTERMVQSPTFMRSILILSAAVLVGFLGILGGVTGWGASALLRLAWSGQHAA